MRETMFRMLFMFCFLPFLPFPRVFPQFAFSFPPVRSNLRRNVHRNNDKSRGTAAFVTFKNALLIGRGQRQKCPGICSYILSVLAASRVARNIDSSLESDFKRRSLETLWNISDTGGFHLFNFRPTLISISEQRHFRNSRQTTAGTFAHLCYVTAFVDNSRALIPSC